MLVVRLLIVVVDVATVVLLGVVEMFVVRLLIVVVVVAIHGDQNPASSALPVEEVEAATTTLPPESVTVKTRVVSLGGVFIEASQLRPPTAKRQDPL